ETVSSIYAVETHLCSFKSVRVGERLQSSTQLLGADAKRLHVFHRMTEAGSGDEVATNELMFLHVDIAPERVTPMPADRRSALTALAAEHAPLPAPRSAGRRIAMPSR